DAAHALDDAFPPTTSPSAHTFTIDVALQKRVLDLARIDDPGTTLDDVRGAAMMKLDQIAKSTPIAVSLFEVDDGVLLSTRSQEPGPALALAESLGGGGHKQKAGGFVPGTLDDVKAKVDAWLARFALTLDPRVRFQR